MIILEINYYCNYKCSIIDCPNINTLFQVNYLWWLVSAIFLSAICAAVFTKLYLSESEEEYNYKT